MRTTRRLSLIALSLLLAAVALAAGERATALVIAPHDTAPAPLALHEIAVAPPARLTSPRAAAAPAPSRLDQAEREKTFAWLLLLLKEQRGAR